MAGGYNFKRRTKGDPCPVCGHGGWCGFYNDGSGRLLCMRFSMGGCPVPAGYKTMGQPGKSGGQVFRPDDGSDGSPATWTKEQWASFEAEKRKREERAQRERQAAKGRALALWNRSKLHGEGVDHPRARAYFEGRGVLIADLPRGKLPETIRWMPDAWHNPSRKNLAAVICCMKDAHGEIVCVQRIYLDGNKKLPGEDGKRMEGASSGAACRLGPMPTTGTLILCEGVETGMALLAACHDKATVWCVMSTSGLINCELPADMADKSLGTIKRIIIAADHDRAGKMNKVRPGLAAARICANTLRTRHPHIPVSVAVPCTRDICGELVDEAGEIAGEAKSVDWLDVYLARGAETVRKAVLGSIDMVAVGGGGDERPPGPPTAIAGGGAAGNGGKLPIIDRMAAVYGVPGMRQAHAACLLMDAFAPAPQERAGSTWHLSYDGQFYVWPSPVDGRPCWVRADERYLKGICTIALDRYFTLDRKDNPLPWTPSDTTVVGAMTAAIPECTVWADQVPCWKPPAFDDEGKPIFRSAGNARAVRPTDDKPAAGFIPTRSGLLDVDALLRGEIRVVEPTPRYFCLNCLPFDLPVDLLEEAMRIENDEGLPGTGFTAIVEQRGLCPNWLKIVERCFNGNAEAINGWQEFCGYVNTPDTSLEVIGVLDGLPGSGKSLLAEGLGYAIGEENVQPVTFETLGGRFDLAPLEGKLMFHMDEFRIGSHTNITAAMDNVLTLSSGNRARSEAKHAQAKSTRRIYGKFLICCNGFPPALRDDSAAIVRRLRVFPVQALQGEPDRTLKGKLRSEALGIFLWSLDGLRRAMWAKKITEPAAGTELREQIRRAMTPIRAFVEEFCIVGPGQAVRCDVLRTAFRKHCEADGQKGLAEISDSVFGQRLRSTIGDIRRDKVQKNGERFQVYRGLRLADHDDRVEDGKGGWEISKRPVERVQDELPYEWRSEAERASPFA